MVLSALKPYAFCVTFVLHTLLDIYMCVCVCVCVCVHCIYIKL